jgi:hypothetical protein
LLGTLAFALALVWIFRGDRQSVTVAVFLLAAILVFAGGQAHRGSVGALALCAVLDVAVAVACLGSVSGAKAFVLAPVAWAVPVVASELAVVMAIAGTVAVLAACGCVAAVPQTRRFAAWSYGRNTSSTVP